MAGILHRRAVPLLRAGKRRGASRPRAAGCRRGIATRDPNVACAGRAAFGIARRRRRRSCCRVPRHVAERRGSFVLSPSDGDPAFRHVTQRRRRGRAYLSRAPAQQQRGFDLKVRRERRRRSASCASAASAREGYRAGRHAGRRRSPQPATRACSTAPSPPGSWRPATRPNRHSRPSRSTTRRVSPGAG